MRAEIHFEKIIKAIAELSQCNQRGRKSERTEMDEQVFELQVLFFILMSKLWNDIDNFVNSFP